MPLQRICAWCGRELNSPSPLPEGAEITHGICRSCGNMVFSTFGIRLTDFINRLAAPVLLLNGAGTVPQRREFLPSLPMTLHHPQLHPTAPSADIPLVDPVADDAGDAA